MIADDNMIKGHSSKGDMENGKRLRKKSWDFQKFILAKDRMM
jgi:hypothetical protein